MCRPPIASGWLRSVAPWEPARMHFHLPKPLHGWRAFVGEVGIIVVGVLIALGAEQVVENLRWRSEAGHFREAVDHELGRDMGVYQAALQQESCADRRLVDLERLLADSRAGRQDKLAEKIGSPVSFSLYFSVWDNKGAEVTAHLPPDVRVGYGEAYDEFRNYETLMTA